MREVGLFGLALMGAAFAFAQIPEPTCYLLSPVPCPGPLPTPIPTPVPTPTPTPTPIPTPTPTPIPTPTPTPVPTPTPLAGPNPFALPVATTSQSPLVSAYAALGVPALGAGSTYRDPTTNVRVWKLTSSTFPTTGHSWGHDYSEGGDEVSLPHTGTTRSVLVYSGDGWHQLIDFTPGVGVSKPRQLTGAFKPWVQTSFAFSSNPSTPYYAYVSNGSSIRRFDVRTLTDAPGGGWPVTVASAQWLQQSENDGLFVWMSGNTVTGYEPSTGTMKTYSNSGLNEPRIDRAGRYVGMSMDVPPNGLVVWDWVSGAVLWTTPGDTVIGTPQFSHVASLKRRWLGINWGLTWPGQYTRFIPDQPNSAANIGGPASGSLTYGNGGWNQSPANPDDQWAVFSDYSGLAPTGAAWLAPGGMILVTASGQRRLLAHPYNTSSIYDFYPFAKFSLDGRFVLFTSDMNGSGRSDVFLVEMP